MSESDEEKESFCYFGKPLEPYDEDAFPKKKPITVEEQVARDAQGRRRFHGAFTGGFSAGFFNTVGSLEGWTPTEFKSTRLEKAKNVTQKPEDYMDDEDLGEFGIAPQTVRATQEYSTSKKRKKTVFSDGPIPGEPVLHSLLSSGNETIGYLLLKNIGLKEKKKDIEQTSADNRVYGCEMPKTYEISREDDTSQYIVDEMYQLYLQKPKDNTFGLGYEGLDKSHINLFKSTKLIINDKNKKKLSISGQAFGVGAFEDDDEDIYVKDDMNRYDFELTNEKQSKKDSLTKAQTVLGDFIAAKHPLATREFYPPPTIPHSFTGKHKLKRSRFEPLPEEPIPERKVMNSDIRAKYLGEETASSSSAPNETNEDKKSKSTTQEIKTEEKTSDEKTPFQFSLSSSNLVFDRFVSASATEDPSNILEAVQPSETTHGTQEMRDAAKMKMFGPLTRISVDWQPHSLLCKRFNVPEPHVEDLNPNKNRKRTRNLIFDYEKISDINVDLKPGLSTINQENVTSEKQETNESTVDNPITDEPTEIIQSEVASVPQVQEDVAQKEITTKDIIDKIDAIKNIDLFRAVFLSSSESEGEDDNETEENKTAKNTEMKNLVLQSNTLVPTIKPIKEGILSNMDFSIFQTRNNTNSLSLSTTPVDNKEAVVESTHDSLSYGPSLPKILAKTSTTVVNKSMYRENESDKWVEKSHSTKKHKKDKKHKHKKQKKKHKESK